MAYKHSVHCLALPFVFFCLTGCGGTPPQNATPVVAAAAPIEPAPTPAPLPVYEPAKPVLSEEQQAIKDLREYSAEVYNKIKEKFDGKVFPLEIRGNNIEVQITMDINHDFDIKKSDSLISKYDGEIYIGYNSKAVSGLIKGIGSYQKKVIKCKYKGGSWELDRPTLLYSDTEFLLLPKKSE